MYVVVELGLHFFDAVRKLAVEVVAFTGVVFEVVELAWGLGVAEGTDERFELVSFVVVAS